MGRAVLDHLEDRVQHPGHGAEGRGRPLLEAPPSVELAEQLVGAVDEVDGQGRHRASVSIPGVAAESGGTPAAQGSFTPEGTPMVENTTLSGEEVRVAAAETVRQGTDIRARVQEITLQALQGQRFDRHGIREVVRAVTEGAAMGAPTDRPSMRMAMSEALQGLDQALRTSAEAGGEALRQLTASGRTFSDGELKSALANLRKLEDDFIATVGQVAEAANEAVRPELRQALTAARRAGTATGRQVALTMGDFAQKFSAASFDRALDGLELAGQFGQRFSMVASGILGAMAEALRAQAEKSKEAAARREP
jgi:hypothetical protein